MIGYLPLAGHPPTRVARLAQDAAETLDTRIKDKDLNGIAEAVEVREALERVQSFNPG